MCDDASKSAQESAPGPNPSSNQNLTQNPKSGHTAKRNRLTWLLAAALLCLVAGIVYLETQDNNALELATRAAEDVQVITITQKGGESIRVERTGNAQIPWKITAPVQLPANEQRIIPLLTVIFC